MKQSSAFFDIPYEGGTITQPCELADLRVIAEMEGKQLADFLKDFHFSSEDEIKAAVVRSIYCITDDPHLRSNDVRKTSAAKQYVFERANKLRNTAGAVDKYATAVAKGLWTTHFAPVILDEAVERMFSTKQSAKAYAHAAEMVKDVYGLSDLDVTKLRFFICQVRQGRAFHPSLRRMLYIWSATKKTGKTTVANMIVTLLNGDNDYLNIGRYQSELSTEMQIKDFALPKIATAKCVLMDECFYRDMGKTYASFKAMMTRRDGRARLPYGQEFEWKGLPNYVATSNDELKTFIKDYDDRRFLSVEFREAPKQLPFDEIHDIWREFVTNCQPPLGYTMEYWSNKIFEECNETGELGVLVSDYEIAMRGSEFFNWLLRRATDATSRTANDNKLTLSAICSEMQNVMSDFRSRDFKEQIAKAFIKTYGDRVDGRNYWYFTDCVDYFRKNNTSETKAVEVEDVKGGCPF